MKKLFLLSFSCLLLQFAIGQNIDLRFNRDGKFKIVQFTDIHYIYQKPEAEIGIERINEIIDAEKPDLVVITGDLIFGKPAKESIEHILKQVSDKKVPFAVVFGNHDDEYELSREQLYEIIRSYPYNVTSTVENLSGVTNFILPVRSTKGDKEETILYFFDSHSYSKLDNIKGYDYVKFDQIQWYREQSKMFTAKNGGNPIPSLAFLHIPFPEFAQAASDETAVLIGTRKEKVCAPQLNSGLFASMREMKDITGVFAGHDHDNDYAVLWKGILLAYGRYTGGNTVYNNLAKGNGARVIELTQGKKDFKTWIHLKGGEIINMIDCPSDFIRE